MSLVFQGEDAATRRQAAVKFLKVDQCEGGVNESTQLKRRFIREVKLMASVRHQHLVEVYDAVLEAVYPYYVMELIDGQTLQLRMKLPPVPGFAAICRLGWQVAAALNAAWQKQRIVHRDLKPGNIMLAGDNVKVIDLGIAKAIGGNTHLSQITTMSGMMIGTPYYMAPEQHLAEKTIDCRTDIYALGLILCELLGMRYPFEGMNHRELLVAKKTGCQGKWERRAHGAPTAVLELVNAMMEPAPEDRPQTWTDVLQVLAEAEKHAATADRDGILVTASQVIEGGTRLIADPAAATTELDGTRTELG